jgi:hypothetical protein
MTTATAAIAKHLNIAEALIAEVQEWAHVLWVRVKGVGARFVSKRVAKMEIIEAKATIQICSDDASHTLIQQMPAGIVLSDGRVQFKTPKGLGFLVSKEACNELGLEPSKAVFDASMSQAHYHINKPIHGKVVKAYVSESGEFKINPEWAAYQSGMNEGGEGYNPHPKHITVKASQVRYL